MLQSMAPVNQSSMTGLPSTLPNPVTMHEGLVVRGNVFVNWHLDPKYPMNIGLDPCYGTGLPCDKPTVCWGCIWGPVCIGDGALLQANYWLHRLAGSQ